MVTHPRFVQVRMMIWRELSLFVDCQTLADWMHRLDVSPLSCIGMSCAGGKEQALTRLTRDIQTALLVTVSPFQTYFSLLLGST